MSPVGDRQARIIDFIANNYDSLAPLRWGAGPPTQTDGHIRNRPGPAADCQSKLFRMYEATFVGVIRAQALLRFRRRTCHLVLDKMGSIARFVLMPACHGAVCRLGTAEEPAACVRRRHLPLLCYPPNRAECVSHHRASQDSRTGRTASLGAERAARILGLVVPGARGRATAVGWAVSEVQPQIPR